MSETMHGYEKKSVGEILTGDIVMMHPEDQFDYRAERQRDGSVVLRPMQTRCSTLTYTDSSFRLWVRS